MYKEGMKMCAQALITGDLVQFRAGSPTTTLLRSIATSLRSAQGTDRDIPASFLRSCSGRMPSSTESRREVRHGRAEAQVPGSLDVQPRAMRGGGVPQGAARRAGDRGGGDRLPERRAVLRAARRRTRRAPGRVRPGRRAGLRHRDAGRQGARPGAPHALLPGRHGRGGAGVGRGLRRAAESYVLFFCRHDAYGRGRSPRT